MTATDLVLVRHNGALIAAHLVPHSSLPEYKSWQAMMGRCFREKGKRFKSYGGRGITVCARWKSFANFYLDMGSRPTPKHSLDRRDNDGNYEPSNCRWATDAEQRANKRNSILVIYNGASVRLMDVPRPTGFTLYHVYGRLKSGWTLDEALTIPINRHKKKRRKDRQSKREILLDNNLRTN